MTSRQRVLAALNHRQPDRVPIDLGGNQTGIHKNAYQALVRHLRLDEEIEIMDAVQQLARPSEAVLQRLRIRGKVLVQQPGGMTLPTTGKAGFPGQVIPFKCKAADLHGTIA